MFSKHDVPVVFYSTKGFGTKKEVLFSVPSTETPHEDVVPDIAKSRFANWAYDYAFDEKVHEPVEFVYNETGELWEDKMGIDFLKEDWYDDISEIQSRIYANASKFVPGV